MGIKAQGELLDFDGSQPRRAPARGGLRRMGRAVLGLSKKIPPPLLVDVSLVDILVTDAES